MKYIKKSLTIGSLLLLLSFLNGCMHTSSDSETNLASREDNSQLQTAQPVQKADPVSLPVKYSTPAYVVDTEDSQDLTAIAEDSTVKVGARIVSTKGPQPLWDILKRLASLKGMSVNWAQDVDQNAAVDVDINPKDDFKKAIDGLLGQIGYFAEIDRTTISVYNKITKRYQIAMPFLSQAYTTETGGDIMGSGDDKNGYKATINLKSEGSPVGTASLEGDGSRKKDFDAWANIESNLKVILDILETSEVTTSAYEQQYGGSRNQNVAVDYNKTESDTASGASEAGKGGGTEKTKVAAEGKGKGESQKVKTSRQVSKEGSYFIIDKPVGIITVTATRTLQKKVEDYIESLKKSLYKQVIIEAKIIEVQLSDGSSLGINWSSVLKNFALDGSIEFGADGQIYPFIFNNDEVNGTNTYSTDESTYFRTINPGQFISKLSINTANFEMFINALKTQGDTKVLSNPKISVLNGQPAFITVGENITYIDNVETTIDSDSGIITYTVDTERILSGIGMTLTATILGERDVIMNLVPITSELQEPIEYKDFGTLGATVGLPRVDVREMSTTVKVKDNEMLVIGGLISDKTDNSGEFMPLLGDIPFVKYLFGYEEKSHVKKELIILLRPRII